MQATAATLSPTNLTVSMQKMFSSQRAGVMPYLSVGTSLWVITAFTPGIFSASDVSMERMRAWACGLVRILP